MEIILNIIIGLAIMGLLILFFSLFVDSKVNTKPDNASINNTIAKPPKNIKTNIANSYSLKNEKSNFQKKQQKARNQGKLQFYFHGEYYPTGLLVINGGK